MKKRILSLLLSVVALTTSISCLDFSAYAATQTYTSGSVTCTYNTDTGVMTLSGNGAMADYTSSSYVYGLPWRTYRTKIKSVVVEPGVTKIGNYAFYNSTSLETVVFNGTSTVTNIGNSAFEGCTASTYWLDIPASVTSIGSKAFHKTNFNYVKIFSPSISIDSSAFRDKNGNGGYARFFGVHDSGARAFVQTGQSQSFDWHYYCIIEDGHNITNGNHTYELKHFEPTCSEQGYDWYGCLYCDADPQITNIVPATNHDFVYNRTSGTNLVYSCRYCGLDSITLDAIAVMHYYQNAISFDEGTEPYQQSNYVGAADIHKDGYINAKDFIEISRIINSIDVSNKKTTLNTSTTYQTMDGFGASGCWWAQEVGGWDNLDEIIDLLYDDEKGIGLDIYRYNLGGGSVGDTTIGDWRRRAESFLNSSSNINDPTTYNWNADVNARRALASAQRANPDLKVTLFNNTPPVSLTSNGKGYCNSGSTSNIATGNYQKYATYVINCAEKFKEWGYNVTELSPINEPEWDWNSGSGQEGSHWEPAAARSFYNDYMIPALRNSSLNGIGLSVWECAQLNHSSWWSKFLDQMFSTNSSYSSNNANIRSYTDTLDTHSYWASQSDRNSVVSKLSGNNYKNSVKNIRCTEYCQMTNDGNTGVYDLIQQEGTTNGLTIPYGIAMANIIYQDLTILNAIEWDWWVACAPGVYPDGLVYTNSNDHSDVQTAKRLWCLGNFSRFIDEGAVRIAVSTTNMNSSVNKVAFQNPDGSIAIIYINSTDSVQYTSISGYSSFDTYVTDETMDLEHYQSGKLTSTTPISIPAQSVTTVVVK